MPDSLGHVTSATIIPSAKNRDGKSAARQFRHEKTDNTDNLRRSRVLYTRDFARFRLSLCLIRTKMISPTRSRDSRLVIRLQHPRVFRRSKFRSIRKRKRSVRRVRFLRVQTFRVRPPGFHPGLRRGARGRRIVRTRRECNHRLPNPPRQRNRARPARQNHRRLCDPRRPRSRRRRCRRSPALRRSRQLGRRRAIRLTSAHRLPTSSMTTTR